MRLALSRKLRSPACIDFCDRAAIARPLLSGFAEIARAVDYVTSIIVKFWQEGCDTVKFNTFLGDDALLNNIGSGNRAIGAKTLLSNTTGSNNTAIGFQALFSNTTVSGNTGFQALCSNTTGNFNTATGQGALSCNTKGDSNTASGNAAL